MTAKEKPVTPAAVEQALKQFKAGTGEPFLRVVKKTDFEAFVITGSKRQSHFKMWRVAPYAANKCMRHSQGVKYDTFKADCERQVEGG